MSYRRLQFGALVLLLVFALGERAAAAPANTFVTYLPLVAVSGVPPLVFVSRQIPADGSIYWDVPKDMPGVGAHSRFRVAAPGQLLVRESNGSLRMLVDRAHPNAASLNLI